MTGIDALLRAVPNYAAFFSLDEMQARLRELTSRYPGLFRRRTIGRSRDGRSIELLSAGHGPRSVMVVGAPHPHEMVGTLTIDFLAHHLAEKPQFQADAGCSWHFIQVIEPDGVHLNESWFAQPLRPSNYFRSFYRPPLHDQAEYTFPFSTRDHSFGMTTAESNAWRTALDWVRPDLLVSLHNSEVGGAFFFTSGDDNEFDSSLLECAGWLGFEIDGLGEPGSLPKAGRPGIFRFPDEVEQSILDAETLDATGGLLTGDSSAGYAQRQFGTFSLVPEVPYWRLREGRSTASLPRRSDADALVDGLLPSINCGSCDGNAERLLRAVQEQVGAIPMTPRSGVANVAQSLVAVRRPAMLFGLATRLGQPEIAARLEPALEAWCATLDDLLEQIPLVQLVRLQVASVWLAAMRLRTAGHQA